MMRRPPSSTLFPYTTLFGPCACSAAEPVRDKDTVAVGVGEPASLNPGLVTDLPGRVITGALWTPLATYDADKQQVTPLAADRKSTRLNSSHSQISYAVFSLK